MTTTTTTSTIRCIFSPFERNILYEALLLYREKKWGDLNRKPLTHKDAVFQVESISPKNAADFNLLVEDLSPVMGNQYRVSFSQKDLDYINAAIIYLTENRSDLITSDEMTFALAHILEVSKQKPCNDMEYSKV